MLKESIEANKIIETNKQIKNTKSILKNIGLALMIVLVSGLYGCKKIKTNEVKDDKKIVLIESLFKDIKKRIDSLENNNYNIKEAINGTKYEISEDGKTIIITRICEDLIIEQQKENTEYLDGEGQQQTGPRHSNKDREYVKNFLGLDGMRYEITNNTIYIEISEDNGVMKIGGNDVTEYDTYYTESGGDCRGSEEKINILSEDEVIQKLRIFTKDLK